ncbi:hypothetical protein GMORB2_5135 [Geosmithia morbida]|uniref:Mediator of RNA polymerase II transcription subunit 17 n=1 Tax=Geosmithia morbida TaxID=1094350 RepID=A0A9P4Z0N8_9HYPO|nr:uncharacterized protein GMORB2_5135 [Geosmithia morbida]KAF4124469.1 hypothetical protein GMORB2_5135 [Geosmithia morbida]
MAPPEDGTPLSLKPFPVSDKKPKNVAEFIARVNAQPGGFRALSAAKLREEAARQARGGAAEVAEDVDMASDDDDGDDDDDDDDDDESHDANDTADPLQARFEVLKNVEIAAQTAMLTLDSVSLLLSKQNPTQASLTLSKQLRDVVGIGSLGSDRLAEPATDQAKDKDQETVALGWTLMEINKTRDSAKAACAFLTDEMESETKYWEDIIGVQANGWSVCKMPQDRHTLGVRVGFSEAIPEFRAMGLVPIRRHEDGSANLDGNLLRLLSQRLIITCERDGQVLGRCALDLSNDEDAALETRVLEARNKLFDEELWHELGREARSLAAYDVNLLGSTLTYDVDGGIKVTMQFLSPDSPLAPDVSSLPVDDTAEAISLTLHILLSYAHRFNELMRKRPLPPHYPRNRGQVATLLRPIIARSMCLRSIESCTRFVGGLVRTLRKAGLDSSFILNTSHQPPPSEASSSARNGGGPHQLPASQLFVRNMLQPADFYVVVNLVPDVTFTIRGRTLLHPITATYYYILPSPSLDQVCPPHRDAYTTMRALSEYLCTATGRLLTEFFLARLPAEDDAWTRNMQGTAIRRTDNSSFQCLFHVGTEESERDDITSDTDDDAALPLPVLSVHANTSVDGKNFARTLTWAGHKDDDDNAPSTSLEQAVKGMTESLSRV